ncbi:beta-1,6-N-acetylglucosaminyltransferase [Telmatobacter sp. DSM 110680]|uniref:Peptide O-xylosyltransferase n=1 Tax=Telmatobacter sp. DSM 110680 TaxID=3036704 RepID=A0AAU7DMX7_9BACT
MSQIGFVIITHTAPEQIVRLIRTVNLVYANPPIVLHHDFDQSPLLISLPANVQVVRPHISTRWCGYSVVQATLAALALLYASPAKPDWFALLSGACYPTKPAKAVISDLENGGFDAHMDYHLIDPSHLDSELQCEWYRRYYSLKFGLAKLDRRALPPFIAKLTSPYSKNHTRCYAGSEWFTGNRRVAEYILGSKEQYSWLAKHLQGRHCPDETYFQTVVCNAPAFRLSKNNYRFIDWSSGAAHPKTLETDDLESILGSSAHFARKFAPDSRVLNRLDDYLEIRHS